MQQLQTSLAPGTLVQERYKVEGVLGKGGSSIVYLVRDMHYVNDQNVPGEPFFALKVLMNQNEQEQLRLAFEGEVLQRLSHGALPSIYQVYAGTRDDYAFILMDYIEGPSLDALRRQQPEERFSLPLMLQMMEPVVDAIAYLHKQQPPIIHRDIKPGNIIVPGAGKSAVLVDFGIAKEYDPEATTTALRRVSPGYGAPEQYSSVGTYPRTDIYGLAATCYTLLTGSVPADAFHRLTNLASNNLDPLIPVNARVPTIPEPVAQVLQRALSVRIENRFSTVEEFWQALKAGAMQQTTALAEGKATSSGQAPMVVKQAGKNSLFSNAQRHGQRSDRKKHGFFLTLALIFPVLLILGLGFRLFTYSHSRSDTSARVVKSLPVKVSATATAATATYPMLASTYSGTIHDLLTQTTTSMSLTKVQQNSQGVDGSFAGLQVTGAFKGVLDGSKHIFFTVTVSTTHKAFFFEGTVRQDHNLAGNFCNVDAVGQCVSDYGVWSVAPGP